MCGGDPVRARVGDFTKLSEGLFVTSERRTYDKRGAATTYQELETAAGITRTWGDAYGYALVATGRAIVNVDPIMEIWDATAVQPVMLEAGGTFTNWLGESTIHSREGIGTVPGVLPEILAITRRATRLTG